MGVKQKRVLLTGATGFVGSAVQQRIVADAQYDLILAVRRPVAVTDAVRVVQVADFTAQTDWSEALQNVDVVINCAARAHVMNEDVPDPLIEFRKTKVYAALALAQ